MIIAFDGQQQDERVLLELQPYPLIEKLNYFKILVIVIFFIIMVFLIATVTPNFASLIKIPGILLILIFAVVAFWWNHMIFKKSKTYITDRRIIRFDPFSPFVTAKRALFWNEALKAKAYNPSLLMRFFKVGIVQVEPHLADHENVVVRDIYMFEDVANYIDKILFIFKNKPDDIVNIKPFVFKARGERD